MFLWFKFYLILDLILLAFVSILISIFCYLQWTRHFLIITLTLPNENYFKFFFVYSTVLFLFSVLQLWLIQYIKKAKLEYNEQSLSVKKKNFLSKLKILQKILTKLNIFYLAYNLIFKYFGPGNRYAVFVIRFTIFVLSFSKLQIQLIISLFVILPKLIIICIFIYELYLGQLHYYFYSNILMIFVYIIQMLLFILRDIGPRLLPEAEAMINHFFHNGKFVSVLKPEYSDVSPEYFFYGFYEPLSSIENFIKVNVLPIYTKLIIYSNCMYFGILLLGFFYSLLKIYNYL